MTATEPTRKGLAERQYAAALEDYQRAAFDDHAKNAECLSRMCQALEQQVRELRNDLEGGKTFGNGLLAMVNRVNEALAKLQPCPELPALTALEAVKTEPTIRVRLRYRYGRDGSCRLRDPDVEWLGPGLPNWEAICGQLRAAHVYGRTEAEDRNHPLSPREEGGAE